MRLTKKVTPNLYAQSFMVGQKGGFEVYRGSPHVLTRSMRGGGLRGGFFNVKALAKLGGDLVKSVAPKVGKRIIKEVGPQIMREVVKQGAAVASGKKTVKKALKQTVKAQSKEVMKKSAKILRSEVKKKIKGGGKGGGKTQKGGVKNQKGGIKKKKRTGFKIIKKGQDIFDGL